MGLAAMHGGVVECFKTEKHSSAASLRAHRKSCATMKNRASESAFHGVFMRVQWDLLSEENGFLQVILSGSAIRT